MGCNCVSKYFVPGSMYTFESNIFSDYEYTVYLCSQPDLLSADDYLHPGDVFIVIDLISDNFVHLFFGGRCWYANFPAYCFKDITVQKISTSGKLETTR